MVDVRPVVAPVILAGGPIGQVQARRLSMWSVGGLVRGVGLFALWLGMSGAGRPVRAQALNNVVRPTSNPNASVFTPPAGLASGYDVTIQSDWNRPGIMQACAIDGGESVSGRLTWTGTNYVGVLRRESKYTECGVHGATTCIVSISGSGDVQVSGRVSNEEGTPNLYLRWSPARDTRIAVEGNCPAKYRSALARMYNTVTHAVLMPLPRAGDGEVALALEDQPWRVRISP